MNTYKTIVTAILVYCLSPLFAQNEVDALRYSRIFHSGSARYTGMGGAFNALGGDVSAIHYNPAAIGVFRKSEFQMSTDIIPIHNSTGYAPTSEASATKFGINNIGGVIKLNSSSYNAIKNMNLGLSFNRSNHFKSNIDGRVSNQNFSILESFRDDIYNDNYDPFGSEMAWNLYLIDTISGNPDSLGLIYGNTPPQENQIKYTENGYLRETAVSFGMNINHQLFLGTSMGLQKVRFEQEKNWTEGSLSSDTINDVNSIKYDNTLLTTGNGINFKIGATYAPSPFFRLAASIHTPTYYNFNDKWTSQLQAELNDSSTLEAKSPQGEYDYDFQSPWVLESGIAFVIGKLGVIAIDYTRVNYARGKLYPSQTNGYSFEEENTAIKNIYKSSQNLRAGIEIRTDPFRFRFGLSYIDNSYSDLIDNSNYGMAYSTGFGYRLKHFYLEMAYQYTVTNTKFYIWNPDYVSATELRTYSNRLISTIGFRF